MAEGLSREESDAQCTDLVISAVVAWESVIYWILSSPIPLWGTLPRGREFLSKWQVDILSNTSY